MSPLSALLLAEIAHSAGLPDGVLNTVQGIGEEVELPTGETVWRLAKPQQSEPDGAQVVTERFLDSEPAPDWALRPPTSEPEPARFVGAWGRAQPWAGRGTVAPLQC